MDSQEEVEQLKYWLAVKCKTIEVLMEIISHSRAQRDLPTTAVAVTTTVEEE